MRHRERGAKDKSAVDTRGAPSPFVPPGKKSRSQCNQRPDRERDLLLEPEFRSRRATIRAPLRREVLDLLELLLAHRAASV